MRKPSIQPGSGSAKVDSMMAGRRITVGRSPRYLSVSCSPIHLVKV
jgi:hypothetical protein